MRNLIATTILVFIVNFILQVVLDFALTSNNGEITISDPIKIDSVNYTQTILLSNYKRKTIVGLEFYASKGNIDSLYKNDKIKIVVIGKNKFRIYQLYPHLNTTIMVSMKGETGGYPEITPLNNDDFKFLYKKSSEFKEETIDWLTISVNCLLVSLFYAFFLYFVDKNNLTQLNRTNERLKESEMLFNRKKEILESQIGELTNQIETTKKETRVSNKKADKQSTRIDQLYVSWAKIRLLLIRQVRDLKKENEFYKSLLTNMVEKSNNKIEINRLDELIKDNLQTHSTKINIEKDAKLIDTIADILSDKKTK